MLRTVLAFTLVLSLAACEDMPIGGFSAFSNSPETARDTSNREYYESDAPIVKGRVLFRDEAYGRAYKQFKDALNEVPNDPAALLGFAASADMLGRFDQSNSAYAKLQPVIGNRIEYHNNRGYSLLLQGQLVAARRHFLRAYEIDPSNERAANNLELLRNSVNYPSGRAAI
ncbi:tetratricopeptide repeat protein [Sulfitobacter aestuariivivens]|uniref:tetratricopeptide repeat protein n=1 Tax=Sulfitobacter aestuariivivens TaxID=2766981 RepID=UPI00361BA7AC